MNTGIALAFSTLLILGCAKTESSKPTTQIGPPANAAIEANPATAPNPIVINLENLVGTWILLTSDGEPAVSHDYMSIKNVDGVYSGILRYQGSTKDIKLKSDGKIYLAISSLGEKYKLYQVRSRFVKENNGIGIDLLVGDGVDDIELGSFQREDILKNLEGQ